MLFSGLMVQMSRNIEERDRRTDYDAGRWIDKAASLWPILVLILYLFFNTDYFKAMFIKFTFFLKYIL